MFSVGELVVHPMHGAGMIDAIEQERVCGVTQDYYVFKMKLSGLILKIPIANSDLIGLRPLSDRETVTAVLDALPTLTTEDSANWNKRYRDNLQKLKSGDLYQLAGVIKSLTRRGRARGLSTGERKMLHNAKQIFISEVVLAGAGDYAQVEQRMDRAMEKT